MKQVKFIAHWFALLCLPSIFLVIPILFIPSEANPVVITIAFGITAFLFVYPAARLAPYSNRSFAWILYVCGATLYLCLFVIAVIAKSAVMAIVEPSVTLAAGLAAVLLVTDKEIPPEESHAAESATRYIIVAFLVYFIVLILLRRIGIFL